MKKYSFIGLSVFLFFLISCGNQGNNSDLPADVVRNPISASGDTDMDQLPFIEFQEATHDFGNVIQGEKVSFGFRFTNTGKTELVIAKVSASCGCTATDYPRNVIKPGEKGVITVTFDSENRLGFQNKSVDVMANTQPNITTLRIKARVITPESMNN